MLGQPQNDVHEHDGMIDLETTKTVNTSRDINPEVLNLDFISLDVCYQIAKNPGIEVKGIADKIHVSRPVVSIRTIKLVESNLIVRHKEPGKEHIPKAPFRHFLALGITLETIEAIAKAKGLDKIRSLRVPKSPESEQEESKTTSTLAPNTDNTSSQAYTEPTAQTIGTPSMTLNLDEVWNFVQEMTEIFTDKIGEQEVRIAELENQLSLTRSTKTAKDPKHYLNTVRSKLNVQQNATQNENGKDMS